MSEKQKITVVEYLKNKFCSVIKYDLEALLSFYKVAKGGFHIIAREAFCYIDYFGNLRYNTGKTTADTIDFIENYMSQADPKYAVFGALIYVMWRHGTVHEFGPKKLKTENDNCQIWWKTSKSDEQNEVKRHLCFERLPNRENSYMITINLFKLVKDLRFAYNCLVEEIEKNPKIMDRVQTNYDLMTDLRFINEISNRSIRAKVLKAISGAGNNLC